MKFLKIICISILISLGVFAYGFDLSTLLPGAKPEAILDAIQRDEYLRPHFTYESSIANFAQEMQCIHIDHSLHKGGPQRADRAFKWVIDVPVDSGNVSSRITAGISELDALVAAELLSKERVSLEADSAIKSFDRYRLTVKGWAESISMTKGDTCFYLGRAKHLKVISVKEIEVPISRDESESAYEVTALVGFPSDFKLPDWARLPEVRKVLPLINKLVVGYERKILMVKSFGRWQEYLPASAVKRMDKSGKVRSTTYFSNNQPTIKREALIDLLSIQENENPHLSCISLPGDSSNGARVDKNLISSARKYSVALFNNKERAKWDNIETTTRPYLERLVSAGLLMSKIQSGIEGENQDLGRIFEATIYQLTPEYEHIFDQTRHCIYMGKGKVNIVDLKIIASNTWDLPFGKESANYKYIMTFPDPPEWTKDPVLQAWWSDLKGALKYGLACEGTFEIDLTETEIRKMGSGSGSCWWAYESFAEL